MTILSTFFCLPILKAICTVERVWLVRLVLNAETVECMSWVCWSKLCCEILLLLNMADMDCLYVKGCGVSRNKSQKSFLNENKCM